MARDPYRASTGDLGRTERWDRDRFYYERDRDRYGDVLEREYEEDDRVYSRAGPPLRRGLRHESPPPPRPRRAAYDDEEDIVIRERRSYHDDLDGLPPRYPRRPPPEAEFDKRVVVEKEREYVRRSPSPPPLRRPAPPLLRRQSSLDTFDRRPRGYYEREEYGPPARRDDYRVPPYVDIPLPRSKGLPPPRRYAERDSFEEIRVSEADRYGDDVIRSYPERVREKEVIRTRRRDRSAESRSTRSRARSRSSSVSSSSSSSSAGGTSVKSKNEYPKKGKTRIPARLVSKRALIDLGYPFVEEGKTIVVLRALGQENIDDLLKLSEDYKKSDLELATGRTSTDDVVEERREEVIVKQGAPAPAIEVVDTSRAVVRAVSPSPSRSTRTRSLSTSTRTSATPLVIDARPREVSSEIAVGPLAIVESGRHRHHHHHHHRRDGSRDIIKAERLPGGEIVLYEEEVERVEEPNRGVRIEKDKKGPPPHLMRAMLATLT
ncbi:hypothetical protein VTK73DRAFT_8259 [Phialemonium thermophilum]|uniref:DUF8035 domain-containing protein n=1 Tax=Phialemonium thermophilum TaxID=223376 RepID=A0ABR3XPX9_9PEZI